MSISIKKTHPNQRLIFSLGDPTGIGIEVILKALGSKNLPKDMEPILVGCKKTVEKIYSSLVSKGIKNLANPKDLIINDFPLSQEIRMGEPNAISGAASFLWLTKASEFLLKKEARALVTGPIAKHAWHKAGFLYAGQTERLGELTKSKNTSMLFTAVSEKTKWRINTLLATTHIPLNEIHNKLSPKIITEKLNILLAFCQKFKTNPRLQIAGLNPHAGEEGNLGLEEIAWIMPTLERWKKDHPEIMIEGPVPPDSCWISSAQAWNFETHRNAPDGILALYHDQGLIPIKLIAFDSAVNTTLGLPFIRTSPDHGTAFDIAGKGTANHKSMLAAINSGWELS